MISLIIKECVTLLVLVGPVSMIPLYVAAVDGLPPERKQRFARTLGVTVIVALLVAAFMGSTILGLLGVSVGSMRVGGGILVLLLAVAMVLGKESSFKVSLAESNAAVARAGIVPLGVPLLAGPAAFSYVMGQVQPGAGLAACQIVIPILVVGAATWTTYALAARAGHGIPEATLNLIERIGGFLLTVLAVEMIAAGLRQLFPGLG